VVVYACKPRNQRGHECISQHAIARRIAAIKGYDFNGEFDPSCRYEQPLYFVPSDTLVSTGSLQTLGVMSEHDLFGGVVPFSFVTAKTITHGLPDGYAHAPQGWSSDFARRVRNNVLPGFSAFTISDARNASMQLLKQGKVRIKKASGIGGLGQTVVADADELEACLESLNVEELRQDGVVLEANLMNVATYSVGQTRIADMLATYCGTQRLTANNHGQEVYGGSSLIVVRGDFDTLLRLELDDAMRTGIAQARAYHDAALDCYSGMYVSRANYDVAHGIDEKGQWQSGVLEQSWRIGGASAAELAAMGAFRADPGLNVVRASTTEIYGDNVIVPDGADIHYQGVDDRVGPLTKYSQLENHVNTR
jgi:hypothetical protein